MTAAQRQALLKREWIDMLRLSSKLEKVIGLPKTLRAEYMKGAGGKGAISGEKHQINPTRLAYSTMVWLSVDFLLATQRS
jgi:hypothetical protein